MKSIGKIIFEVFVPEKRNIEVLQRWQAVCYLSCVWFNRPEIWTPDLKFYIARPSR